MTVRDLINGSFRLLGTLASGEQATAAEAADALASLNSLLDSWKLEALLVYAILPQTFPLVGGKMIGSVVMVCGILVLALMTGILATGFSEEERRREYLRVWDQVTKVPMFTELGTVTLSEIVGKLRVRHYPPRIVVVRRFCEQVGPPLAGIEEAAIDASGSSSTVRGRLRVTLTLFSRGSS